MSGARRIVASVCGPRPFRSTSKTTVIVPSSAVVTREDPEGRVIETSVRRTAPRGCAAGAALATGLAGGAGARAGAVDREGSPAQAANAMQSHIHLEGAPAGGRPPCGRHPGGPMSKGTSYHNSGPEPSRTRCNPTFLGSLFPGRGRCNGADERQSIEVRRRDEGVPVFPDPELGHGKIGARRRQEE